MSDEQLTIIVLGFGAILGLYALMIASIAVGGLKRRKP